MDTFARRNPAQRIAAIEEAANRLDLPATIIEKDFWVCWTLRRLVEHPALGPHLTFKGGTSLSKAYGIIERFSEDIDLTIGRTAPFVKDTKPPLEDGISGNEVGRRADALTKAATQFVAEVILPELHASISAALGTDEGWKLEVDPTDAQTVLFQYPRLASYGRYVGGAMPGASALNTFAPNEPPQFVPGYIKPVIKLEFGARGDIEPSEVRIVRPYVADQFPDLFDDAETKFSTLAAERTFWEKATILHALYHGVRMRDRMSRHYYDLHMLTKKGISDVALRMPDLLAQVVRNKSLLFRDPKASYGTAVFGTLKLIPKDDTLAELRRDYVAMTEMLMGEAPAFNAVMASIAEIEKAVNAGTKKGSGQGIDDR